MAPPLASAINIPAFKYMLNLYPSVIEAFYTRKVQDKKKREHALETEHWRYNELPKLVQRWTKEDGLKKEQLERLVQWKITHGTYRPFLPAQIRKNDPKTVESETSTVYHFLTTNKTGKNTPEKTLRTALDGVCKLRGVGPATGTLLLSIFHPESIAFFEDELYYWLLPEGSVKLKYNVKEYMELYKAVDKMRTRFGTDDNYGVPAWEIEKVGFVAGHWNDVRDEDKRKVAELMSGPASRVPEEITARDRKRKANEDLSEDRKKTTKQQGHEKFEKHDTDAKDRSGAESKPIVNVKAGKPGESAPRRSERIRK